LTSKLNQESKEKSETMKMQRDADKSIREIQLQLTESERQRLKLQEELRTYESKVIGLRETVDQLVSLELFALAGSLKFHPSSKTPRVTYSWKGAGPSVKQRSISKELWREST
jgi:predicted nuclease with TOPRIM domain